MTLAAQKIEALLFAAGEAVAQEELAKLLAVSPEELNQAVQELQQQLADHGLSVIQTTSHVELVTSAAVAEYLATWLAGEEKDLSKAAAETLGIIAYRGPIARYDVDLIRGVDSRHIMKQLLRRGVIVRAQSTTPNPQYEITEDFLKHLGLTTREQLPQFEELSSHEKITRLLRQQEISSL